MATKYNPFTNELDYLGEEGKDYDQEIAAIHKRIDDLHYVAIAFTSNPVCSPAVSELGSTVNSVTISWKLNKTAATLTLDGEALDTALSQKTLAGLSLTAARSFSVKATDDRQAVAQRNASINFYNSIYYGTGEEGLQSVNMQTFTTRTQAARSTTFSVNAGAGQYIYFALPKRYGTPTFNVGGFDGGFSLVAEYSHTNKSGYQETYCLYRSDNANLGQTTVKVS